MTLIAPEAALSAKSIVYFAQAACQLAAWERGGHFFVSQRLRRNASSALQGQLLTNNHYVQRKSNTLNRQDLSGTASQGDPKPTTQDLFPQKKQSSTSKRCEETRVHTKPQTNWCSGVDAPPSTNTVPIVPCIAAATTLSKVLHSD